MLDARGILPHFLLFVTQNVRKFLPELRQVKNPVRLRCPRGHRGRPRAGALHSGAFLLHCAAESLARQVPSYPDTLWMNLPPPAPCGRWGAPELKIQLLMSQQLKTIQYQRYEVRSPEPCEVSDAEGLHLCTALPGCMAEFYGDGRPVTLSSDQARMREIPGRREQKPWEASTVAGDEAALVLHNRVIYRAGEMRSLTLNADMESDTFFCELGFTSGATPTALSVPAEWKWFGEHLTDGVFVPQSQTRYRLVVLSDGMFIRAAAEGIAM